MARRPDMKAAYYSVNSVSEANKLPGDGSCGTSGDNTTVIGRERGGGGGTGGGR